MHQFDPNIPGPAPGDPALIEGDVHAVIVRDPGTFAPFDVGNKVLNRRQAFQINVKWRVTGLLGPLWLTALGGNWNVQVFAESMGGGPERLLATDSSVAADATKSEYEAILNVPPNTLPEGNPGSNVSGLYKLVVSVFLDSDIPGDPGFDMIGFNEGPFIQIEDPR
jgi:hypothetical protein